jgi:hypothetical protein
MIVKCNASNDKFFLTRLILSDQVQLAGMEGPPVPYLFVQCAIIDEEGGSQEVG